MSHEKYMREALELAKKGMGYVSPNPMVGAVIVKDGDIIGMGWHEKFGGLHAERNAFADCDSQGIDCTGADMYVTLEPCCHYGKTPPCTEAIIEHKISRVFVGSADPNPLVAGKGAGILRENGIEVIEDILRKECDELNESFFKYITTGKPFVTLKYAMTSDGKIACRTGDSKWITGESARKNVHLDRMKHMAVMTGVGTVIADDPMLTCRLENGRDPVRIICDTHLRTPIDSNIANTANKIPTVIAYCQGDDFALKSKGCRLVKIPEKDGHVDLNALMDYLADELKISSILLEGGGEINHAALVSGIVDKVQTYIAPKIFGGRDAKTPVAGTGAAHPSECVMLYDMKIQEFDGDILIESRVKNVHGDN